MLACVLAKMLHRPPFPHRNNALLLFSVPSFCTPPRKPLLVQGCRPHNSFGFYCFVFFFICFFGSTFFACISILFFFLPPLLFLLFSLPFLRTLRPTFAAALCSPDENPFFLQVGLRLVGRALTVAAFFQMFGILDFCFLSSSLFVSLIFLLTLCLSPHVRWASPLLRSSFFPHFLYHRALLRFHQLLLLAHLFLWGGKFFFFFPLNRCHEPFVVSRSCFSFPTDYFFCAFVVSTGERQLLSFFFFDRRWSSLVTRQNR